MDETKDLVIYLDDNDTKITAFVEITDLNPSYITFLTNSNEITIPITRILKIKRKKGECS